MADTQPAELTVAQLASMPGGDGKMVRTVKSADERQWPLIKKHPTVVITRAFAVAPMLACEWIVTTNEDAPPDAKKLIEDLVLPLKDTYMPGAAFGCWDNGWQAWEKIANVDAQGRWYISKLKQLLHAKTDLKVDPSGALLSVKNYEVELPIEACLVNYINVEGTNWYGRGYLESILQPYGWWMSTNEAAIRHDKKIAGAHWVVTYPPGQSMYDGVMTPNFEIAKIILASLTSSGSIILPANVSQMLEGVGGKESGWNVDIKSAYPTAGVAFLDRLRYIDNLIARGGEVPERAVFESQYGTKAEAGEHIDWSITNAERRSRDLIGQLNWYVVNQVLFNNFGPGVENTVKVEVSDINQAKRGRMWSVYQSLVTDPSIKGQEYANVDTRGILDALGIPLRAEGSFDPMITSSGDMSGITTGVVQQTPDTPTPPVETPKP